MLGMSGWGLGMSGGGLGMSGWGLGNGMSGWGLKMSGWGLGMSVWLFFFNMKIDILYEYNVLIICVLHDPTTVQVR